MACCCGGCPSITFEGIEFCCVPSYISVSTSGGTGACCYDGVCDEGFSSADCIASGGIYRGDGSDCSPSSCGSALVYEDSENDPPLVINTTICLSDISPNPPCDQRCNNAFTVVGLHNHPLSLDCTEAGLDQDLVQGLEIYVVHADGVWYILALTGFDAQILFYGTTTDIGTPADNEVVCGERADYDNDAFTCLFGSPSSLFGIASNGTATIGGACVSTTGACCLDGTCFSDTSESDCVGAGGTYQGDGTTCDPYPC